MAYSDLRRGRYSEPGREYLITTVVHDRIPVFSDLFVARAFIGEMRKLEDEKRCSWLAWVLMPDHFHGLLSLLGNCQLDEQMNLLKGRSARAVNLQLGRSGHLWQPNFHDHALRKDEDRLVVARYIVANPLRAGLVANWVTIRIGIASGYSVGRPSGRKSMEKEHEMDHPRTP